MLSKIHQYILLSFLTICLCTAYNFSGLAQTRVSGIIRTQDSVKVNARTYSWTWSIKTDQFKLYDAAGRRIVSGPLQPAVVITPGKNALPVYAAGKVAEVKVLGNRLSVIYAGVNTKGTTTLHWRFDEEGSWLEPVDYSGNENEDVVNLFYFSRTTLHQPAPGLDAYWLVQPGLSASAAISPAQVLSSRVTLDTYLGKGATMDFSRILQQWGLPAHFFCGASLPDRSSQVSAMTKLASDAFCCGLADFPAGDLRLLTREGRFSPVVDIRSDLWGQMHGKGPWKLGATLYWAVGSDYRQSIRAYYHGLMSIGLISKKRNSMAKNDVLAAPVFNTWGAQLSINKYSPLLDQEALDKIYKGLGESGMRAKAFVVDDKWEENYGTLEHSSSRLPKFEEFLGRLRKDGFKIGLWSAFFRCDNPALIGLDTTNMLLDVNGRPITKGAKPFYMLDVSQQKVQQVLQNRIKAFMKRYKPDIVKFDFAYELPSIALSIPADKSWAGELFLKRSLDIIVKTLREENPDVVIMYYSLSPLYLDSFDQHSTDDLFLNEEEYMMEANRRLFFSSLLGEIGMPSYGSGGYNWLNMDEIWFDTVPSGALGSLGSFTGDPSDTKPAYRDLAKFNGLARLTRKANTFSVEPMYTTKYGANAARTSSWIRYENGLPVLLALRTNNIVGGKKIEANFNGQIISDVMLVMASTDEKSVTKTNNLGIVPFGEGAVTIRHEGNYAKARVKAHYFNNTSSAFIDYKPINGLLKIPLAERSASGKFVEWFEVNFVN
jgi:hypothetical protein